VTRPPAGCGTYPGQVTRRAYRFKGVLPLAEMVLPGITQVRAQTEPFARAWQAANKDAEDSSAPPSHKLCARNSPEAGA
jgi:hypothetical protein